MWAAAVPSACVYMMPKPCHEALLSMLQAVKDQRGNTWHVTATNRRGIITVEGLSESSGKKAYLCFVTRQMEPL